MSEMANQSRVVRRQTRRKSRACPLFAAVSVGLLFFVGSARALPVKRPVILVFSIEQGFVNSPVQNVDVLGLGRVAGALAALENRYEVYVTLGCAQSDQRKLLKALDIFSAAHIAFFLDTWSSDTIAPPRPAENPSSRPFDRSHGLCQSNKYLQNIKDRYGKDFAGIRLHEVFAANLSVAMFHQGKDWFPRASPSYPAGAYFQKQILEAGFRFAYRNNMKVIFSDPYWLAGGNHFLRDTAVYQINNEEILADVMGRYPSTGIIMYANNEPLKGRPNPLYARIDDWSSLFPSALLRGAIGFGLSDQAWVCDRIKTPEFLCDPKVLSDWASAAIKQGATALEFEPYWYFFHFARPAGDNNNYGAYPDFPRRGTKTNNFDSLIAALDRTMRF